MLRRMKESRGMRWGVMRVVMGIEVRNIVRQGSDGLSFALYHRRWLMGISRGWFMSLPGVYMNFH
jgi:hypothetical protein